MPKVCSHVTFSYTCSVTARVSMAWTYVGLLLIVQLIDPSQLGNPLQSLRGRKACRCCFFAGCNTSEGGLAGVLGHKCGWLVHPQPCHLLTTKPRHPPLGSAHPEVHNISKLKVRPIRLLDGNVAKNPEGILRC